jgi:hypothetical protein
LRLSAAGIEAGVAVDRLVFPELRPVEVGRKIRAPLHASKGIDVNGSHAGATRLCDLTADIAGDLFEIVIGVGDDSTGFPLEREELTHGVLEVARLALRE